MLKPKSSANNILTIVLPVYNVAPYIERCLESICTQDGINCANILIVDDESPDNSIEIAERYLNNHLHIKWRIIRQKNKGLGGARNTGIYNATTPYIWFVDSDDEILAGALLKILASLNNHDEVISFSYIEEPINIVIGFNQIIEHISGPMMIKHTAANQVWRNIYNTDFLRKNKIYFREKFYHEDGEFSMRIYAIAKSISYYPIPIYRYYTNNGKSITNNISYSNFRDLISYVDTYEYMCKRYLLNDDQRWALQREVCIALYYIYSRAWKTTDKDWNKTKCLIQAYRKRIKDSISLLNFKAKLVNRVIPLLPFKSAYKAIYVIIKLSQLCRKISMQMFLTNKI